MPPAAPGLSPLFDLTGRVAIVTGSTKGIGRAMVQGLAGAGATVVVSSRKQELCDQVAREVAAATGSTALGLACHVGEWEQIPHFVEEVHQRLGRIDVLVNNAGINPAHVTATEMTLDYWRKLFSVNLEGPLRLSQLVAPIMADQGGGSIINIATMAAYSGGARICAYGASKAALINLTKSMAQEMAPWNVRVNVLAPGPFESEMVEGVERRQPGFKKMIADGTYLRRVADPVPQGQVLFGVEVLHDHRRAGRRLLGEDLRRQGLLGDVLHGFVQGQFQSRARLGRRGRVRARQRHPVGGLQDVGLAGLAGQEGLVLVLDPRRAGPVPSHRAHDRLVGPADGDARPDGAVPARRRRPRPA